MTYDEIEEASKIASDILKQNKPKPRRVSITQDDKDAFNIVWGMYINAFEASDGDWISEEDQKKIQRMHNKIFGRK